MDEQTPITKSLHTICVENPRFHVHPVFWTSKHLEVLHCHFNHLDSAALSPPPPPLWLGCEPEQDESDEQDEQDEPYEPFEPDKPGLPWFVQMLLNEPSPEVKAICVTMFLRPHGVENARDRPRFFYNQRQFHMPECEVYQTNSLHKLEQQPMIGYYQYEDLIKRRKRANTPKQHPGTSNLPVERLYQRRLRNLTPALWFEDPYLVCVLLSLAQLQWRSKRRSTLEAYPVRLLVTNVSDATHAHVFRADIPSKFLHALDHPTHDMAGLVWPAIQHVQVPFEPHATFSERIAAQLLAGLKPRAPEETPRGEKRKRDGLDTMGQTKSAKTCDTTQLAEVPLANSD
ncbi:hypothetical protein IL306_012388 [Fusarium sp. DS 682]|nr:hypothetical protein IL306_012388 [Fusarium sp. DS 682]